MTIGDEFEIGRGRGRDDNFSLEREWNTYNWRSRFSSSYIKDCYSTDPQALYKVISFGRGKQSLRNILEYVFTRDGKEQEFYSESGEILQGQQDIDNIIDEWSKEFRQKGSGRGQQRQFTHMLFSADVTNTTKNARQVLSSVYDTMQNEFGNDGFEYYSVLHTDTDNPHVHVVIKNYNSLTKKKLRQNKYDFLRIRRDFAKELKSRNLRHVATLRRDRPDIRLLVEKAINNSKQQIDEMNAALDKCAFRNRKTTLTAQLTKQYNNTLSDNASFNYERTADNKYWRVSVDKSGKNFETSLKAVCMQPLNSKNFSISTTNNNATVIVKDIDNLGDYSYNDTKIAMRARFNALIAKQIDKQNNQMAKRTKDNLPKFRAILFRLDAIRKKINAPNNFNRKEKRLILKEIYSVKQKLFSSTDIDKMIKASILVKTFTNEQAIKDMIKLEEKTTKTPNLVQYLKRKRGLEDYLELQKEQINMRIKELKQSGDGGKENNKLIKMLKGIADTNEYNKLLKQHKDIKQEIITQDTIKLLKDKDKSR